MTSLDLSRLDLSDPDIRAWVLKTLGLRSRRHLAAQPLRLRAATGALVAYATTFGTAYPIGNGRSELIERGAFAASIAAQPSIPVMYQHDWNAGPVGTASAREDPHGLLISAHLFEVERAEAVSKAARAGAIRDWSIGFYPTEVRQDGQTDRIVRGDLIEVSLVVRGANPQAKTLTERNHL